MGEFNIVRRLSLPSHGSSGTVCHELEKGNSPQSCEFRIVITRSKKGARGGDETTPPPPEPAGGGQIYHAGVQGSQDASEGQIEEGSVTKPVSIG